MSATAPAVAAAPAPKSEQEIVDGYNRLRQDQSTLMGRIAELDAERHDHALVQTTLKELDGARRCHRLVGGVLVERTVATVLPEIDLAISNIDNVLKNFNDQLQRKEKEMEQYMLTHKISLKGGAQPSAKVQGKASEEGSRGVLA